MGTGEELVIIVDEENNEIGVVRRREMRAGRLRHRATYVLVFNSRGELYVQKRTLSKDVYPGYYDAAAGGVVLGGETYEEGAARELAEELGIKGKDLKPLFVFYYEDEDIRVWGTAFCCIHDGELVLQEEEVESGFFARVDEVMRMAESEPFTPDCLYVLRRYLEREHESSIMH